MTVLPLLLTTLACTTGELYVPEWTKGLPPEDDGGTGGDPGGGTGGGTGDEGTPSEIDDVYGPEDVPCATGDESTRVGMTVEHTVADVPVDMWASTADCSGILVDTIAPLTTEYCEYDRVGDAYVFSQDDPESGEQVHFMYIIVVDDEPTVVLE